MSIIPLKLQEQQGNNGDLMKKTLILLLSIILVILLTACGSGEADQAQVVQNQESGQLGFSGEMPLQSKLLFGSFMLEDTDLAITPEQAEELLPLWQLTKSLIESDTAAQAEVDAVMDSIQDAMTDDQIAYIEEMELGPEQFQQIMEDYDIGFGFRGGEGDTGDIPPGGFPDGFVFRRAEGDTGNVPPGGFSGGFGGVPGQGPGSGQGGGQGFGRNFQDLSPEQQATAQAMREERGGGGRGFFGNPALMEALIDLLEGKLE